MSLALVTLLVYLGLWTNGFVFEDVNGLTGMPWYLRQPWTSPQAYHAVNFALFLVAGGMVARCAQALHVSVLASVAVFWLHPLQVETVSYLAARTDLIAVLCASIGLWAVLTDRSLAIVIWMSAIAALTKTPNAIVGVLLAAVWTYRHAGRGTALAVSLLGVGSGVAWAIARGIWANPEVWAGPSFTVQVYGVMRLVAQTVLPIGLTVSPEVSLTPDWLVGVSVAGFAAAVTWALVKREAFGLVCAWVLLAVSPRLLVRMPAVINTHQFAVAFLGISLGAGRLWATCHGLSVPMSVPMRSRVSRLCEPSRG